MKKFITVLLLTAALLSCKEPVDKEKAKNEILQTEKAFEKMVSEKGMAEAFYYFADNDAVIKRGNDSLITGKDNIRGYYEKSANPDVALSWTPDFIGVSECGTLGYTYGNYIYSVKDSTGKTVEYSGIFHTVWRKRNNEWKYVWD